MPLLFDSETVERFSKLLERAQNIVILSHMNPDGDAVGSALACRHWLRESFFAGAPERPITVVLPHPCLKDTAYLPGADGIVDAVSDLDGAVARICEADLLWGVDFNTASRIEPLDEALRTSQGVKLLCDHHHHPDTKLFDAVISVADLSSTCELLYWLFVQMIGDNSVTDNVARCLYHGINTDTGCFAYSNEEASLYEATAALMRHPLEAAKVHNTICNSYSTNKMRLLGFLISQRLVVDESLGYAYMAINRADLEAQGCGPEELEGLVNYTLMMERVQVGVLVKEAEGKVRLSLRSKDDFDVNRFASKYFCGGGHTKASGATSPYDFETTVTVLEKQLRKELKKHLSQ